MSLCHTITQPVNLNTDIRNLRHMSVVHKPSCVGEYESQLGADEIVHTDKVNIKTLNDILTHLLST